MNLRTESLMSSTSSNGAMACAECGMANVRFRVPNVEATCIPPAVRAGLLCGGG